MSCRLSFCLLPHLICVLSYAAKRSIHATLGALCHRCTTFNVDFSQKTFQHQRGIHSVLNSLPPLLCYQHWKINRYNPGVLKWAGIFSSTWRLESAKASLGLVSLIHIELAYFHLWITWSLHTKGRMITFHLKYNNEDPTVWRYVAHESRKKVFFSLCTSSHGLIDPDYDPDPASL